MKRERPPNDFGERYLYRVGARQNPLSPLVRAVGWLVLLICAGTVVIKLSDTGISSIGGTSMAVRILVVIVVAVALFLVSWTVLQIRRASWRVVGEAIDRRFSSDDGSERSQDEERRDYALADTFTLIEDLVNGHADEIEPVRPGFALRSADELVVAEGRYEMHWWGPVDEQLSTDARSVNPAATGSGDVPSTLLDTEQAEELERDGAGDRTARWRTVDDGILSLTNHGFYLSEGATGQRRFGWDDIVAASMVSPGMVELTAATGDNGQRRRIVSDWAEALFALWAFTRDRSHPQWLDGSWYPYEGARELAARAAELPPPVNDQTDTAT